MVVEEFPKPQEKTLRTDYFLIDMVEWHFNCPNCLCNNHMKTETYPRPSNRYECGWCGQKVYLH